MFRNLQRKNSQLRLQRLVFWHLICILSSAVPGKGPMRAMYEERICKLRLQRVAFRTMWLSAEDYPQLLGDNHLRFWNLIVDEWNCFMCFIIWYQWHGWWSWYRSCWSWCLPAHILIWLGPAHEGRWYVWMWPPCLCCLLLLVRWWLLSFHVIICPAATPEF